MELDFSPLTDDQLIQLIRAACAEVGRRGAACAMAAQAVYLDEVERARVAREAAEREAERLRQADAERIAREAADKVRREAERQKVVDAAASEAKLWARRKGIAQAIAATGYDVKGDQVVVWLSGTKEKRVFLQERGHGGVTYATFYATGNGRHVPGSFEFRAGMTPSLKEALKPVLCAIAKEWNAFRVDLEEALSWSGEVVPLRHLPADPPPPPPEPTT